jgi:uncharacterized protein YqeY
MLIIEKINNGIREAMKSRDQIRLNTFRMLKSKILNVDARANLADADVIKIFKTYYSSMEEALAQAKGVNRPDIADQLEKELVIIQEFLPKAISLDETKKIVLQAIAETGAKTKKEFGLVMKTVMRLNNTVDGKLAKSIADDLLAE